MGGETSFTGRKNPLQILNIKYLAYIESKGKTQALEATIAFSKKDETGVHPHNDDPMVITIRCGEWEIKRVLVNQGNSTNILYWEALERLHLNLGDLKPFKGLLVGFSREHVQVKGYITMKTTYGEHD